MTLGAMSLEAYDIFGRICKAVTGRGSGLNWQALNDAHTLALLLAGPENDPAQVEFLTDRLGLNAGDIVTLEREAFIGSAEPAGGNG